MCPSNIFRSEEWKTKETKKEKKKESDDVIDIFLNGNEEFWWEFSFQEHKHEVA